mmetsp:Transcript_45552/g.96974  ORF Transcript_45552/g.96974 Transcript_45552/m.96974 type:complete len:239 (-) Transcript_45552:358-1074(-)
MHGFGTGSRRAIIESQSGPLAWSDRRRQIASAAGARSGRPTKLRRGCRRGRDSRRGPDPATPFPACDTVRRSCRGRSPCLRPCPPSRGTASAGARGAAPTRRADGAGSPRRPTRRRRTCSRQRGRPSAATTRRSRRAGLRATSPGWRGGRRGRPGTLRGERAAPSPRGSQGTPQRRRRHNRGRRRTCTPRCGPPSCPLRRRLAPRLDRRISPRRALAPRATNAPRRRYRRRTHSRRRT